VIQRVPAPADGFVHAVAATAFGDAALRLGAGRLRKEDPVDHAAGIVCLAKRGDGVTAGEPLAEVHAGTERAAEIAIAEVAASYRIGPDEPEPRPIVLDVIA
jgi:thymidine phosphorylase